MHRDQYSLCMPISTRCILQSITAYALFLAYAESFRNMRFFIGICTNFWHNWAAHLLTVQLLRMESVIVNTELLMIPALDVDRLTAAAFCEKVSHWAEIISLSCRAFWSHHGQCPRYNRQRHWRRYRVCADAWLGARLLRAHNGHTWFAKCQACLLFAAGSGRYPLVAHEAFDNSFSHNYPFLCYLIILLNMQIGYWL